jgi:hypothetical protein
MRTPFFDGELTGACGVRSRKGQSSKCQQQDSTREKDIANTPNSIENPAGESSAFMEPAVGQVDACTGSGEARCPTAGATASPAFFMGGETTWRRRRRVVAAGKKGPIFSAPAEDSGQRS